MTNTPHDTLARAALGGLAAIHTVMLLALVTQSRPHPPNEITLFGIGPFLGATLGIMAAALVLGPTRTRTGIALSLLAGGCALISFGPQKYIDMQFPLIWPSVLTAQAFVLMLLFAIFQARNVRSASA